MITVWGRASSSNVQKVLWALAEIGAAYQRIDAGGRYGGLDTAEFAAMNPNCRIPVLRDGDLTLWESHAIIRYLAARYCAGGLWPQEPATRAIADQWTDWTASTFQPAWVGLFQRLVRVPEAERDRSAIARKLAQSVAAFHILDARLAEVPYLAGGSFTYADIAAGVSLYRWTTMEIERPDLPHVAAWHARLLDRPAFAKTVCTSYAELVGHPAV